jgi:uncharacterized protein YydD (DUF2326 family)
MFIKTLKIENDTELIREIPFHKGINLIVDSTSVKSDRDSGNNVGKTTVLRLIDYCLGGSGTNIYKDPEFKDTGNNQIIEKFLTEQNIIITLVLKKDLDIDSSSEYQIRRNFLSRKDKIQEINGEPFNNKEFPKELKKLIFNSSEDKPTFRQIIAKNVRDEKNRLVNTLKVLHPTTKKEEYESLYLFWLGVDIDDSSRKQKILSEIKVEENLQKRLKKENNYSVLDQSLIVINRRIEVLDKAKDSFNINENYESDLSKLNEIKRELNKLSTRIGQSEMKKELILESKAELSKEISQVDIEQIKALYEEAKILIPNVQKSFEETLSFHNEMISERANFIESELPQINAEVTQLKRDIKILSIEEETLTKKLRKSGAIEELQSIISELNTLFERKGNLEEQKKLWDRTISKLETLQSELETIDKGIASQDSIIRERITKFNEYFSDISSRLYNEQFVLSAEKTERAYELNISSVSGNLGTGKKKGQIAAFDLAYIQFAEYFDIDHINFILHDQIENVHDNQITNLLTEIVGGVNCQYILPVLQDKLPSEISVDDFVVLTLSHGDKLFKI